MGRSYPLSIPSIGSTTKSITDPKKPLVYVGQKIAYQRTSRVTLSIVT